MSTLQRDLTSSQLMAQRPRVREACERLQELAETLGPAAKLPSILELRSTFGISTQTIHTAIGEMVKAGALRSVHGVGVYVADAPEPEPRKGNLAFLIGGAQQDLQGGFWGRLLAGVRRKATESGRNIAIIDKSVPFSDWQNIDGILTTDAIDFSGQPAPAGKSLSSIPQISMINTVRGVHGVSADDFGGVKALTEHLIGLGHRRIAYLITSNPKVQLLRDRRKGYLEALEEADITFDPRWIREFRPREEEMIEEMDHHWIRCGQREITQWLNEDWTELGCTALICLNDETAMGAIDAFRVAGLQTPDDVSVAGFDGTAVWGVPAFQLTTVQVPLFNIGYQATEMLVEWIENPEAVPQEIRVPTRVVPGGSTGPCGLTPAPSADYSVV